jgi:hypothetical protein
MLTTLLILSIFLNFWQFFRKIPLTHTADELTEMVQALFKAIHIISLEYPIKHIIFPKTVKIGLRPIDLTRFYVAWTLNPLKRKDYKYQIDKSGINQYTLALNLKDLGLYTQSMRKEWTRK